jgi:NAD(P)-dependent dehydrogenase (short-subunit alcohol dehydrogenase family)
MALDYGPFNIRVNCVCPGTIETPMHKACLANSPNPENTIHEMLENIPLCRFGQPEEVARVVLFLASDDSSYLTGVALLVDGGQMHI